MGERAVHAAARPGGGGGSNGKAALADAAHALVGLASPTLGPSPDIIWPGHHPDIIRTSSGGTIIRTSPGHHPAPNDVPGRGQKRTHDQAGHSKYWDRLRPMIPGAARQSRSVSLDSTYGTHGMPSSCEQSQHASDDEREGAGWAGSSPTSSDGSSSRASRLPIAPRQQPSSVVQQPYHPQQQQHPHHPRFPRATNHPPAYHGYGPEQQQWIDAQLLTATSVLLAACGVVHALQVSSPPLPGYAVHDGEEEGEEAEEGAGSAHAAPQRQATAATLSAEESAFRASVYRILQQEAAHVRPLGRGDFARLCQLLDLPLSVGAEWQARVLRLQQRLRPFGQQDLHPRSGSGGGGGGGGGGGACAANAMGAFRDAIRDEHERAVAMAAGQHALAYDAERAKVRHFGRQTVWCTVTLLRRVLREGAFPEGGRGLSPSQAEAKLAALAVAAIGGGAVLLEPEDEDAEPLVA